MGWRSVSSWLSAFAAAAGKALHSKHLAGALHVDGVGCTLSVGREVKMEIPDQRGMQLPVLQFFAFSQTKYGHIEGGYGHAKCEIVCVSTYSAAGRICIRG